MEEGDEIKKRMTLFPDSLSVFISPFFSPSLFPFSFIAEIWNSLWLLMALRCVWIPANFLPALFFCVWRTNLFDFVRNLIMFPCPTSTAFMVMGGGVSSFMDFVFLFIFLVCVEIIDY